MGRVKIEIWIKEGTTTAQLFKGKWFLNGFTEVIDDIKITEDIKEDVD